MSEAVDLSAFEFSRNPPEVEAIYGEVREVQEMLDGGHLEPEEAEACLSEINTRWPYQGQAMTITGRAVRFVENTEPDQDSLDFSVKEVFVDKQPVTSLGFTLYRRPAYEYEGEQLSEYVVGHCFYIETRRQAVHPLLHYDYNFLGMSGLNESIVELPGQGWRELAQSYGGEVLEELDFRVLNQANECEAVMALKGMTIDVDAEVDQEYLVGLENYADKVLSVDQHLPYIVDVGGYFYQSRGNGQMVPVEAEGAEAIKVGGYVKFARLFAEANRTDGHFVVNPNRRVWALQIDTLPSDDSGQRTYVLPVDNITDMKSLRQMMAEMVDI